MTPHLSDKIDGYLTKEASEALELLLAVGMDRDLAITFLELNFGDEEIYSLEEDDGE